MGSSQWDAVLALDESFEDQYELCFQHEDCRQDLLMSRCCFASRKGESFRPVPIVTHYKHEPEHTHAVTIRRTIPLGASVDFATAIATKSDWW